MAQEINLSIRRQKGFFSEERLLMFSKIAAVGGIVVVISLSLLFFLLSRDPSVAQVKAEEAKITTQLTLSQNKIATYLVVIDRVNKIQQLQKTKNQFDTNISTLTQQIPSGVTVTSFVLDQKALSLSLQASDVSLLGKAVANFTSLVTSQKIIQDVTIQSLVSDEKGGTYVLTITADLL